MLGRGSKSAKPAKAKKAKKEKAPKAKSPKAPKAKKGAKAAKPKRTVALVKAKNDVYTALLGVAALATLLGVIVLALVANAYKFDFSGSNARVSAPIAAYSSSVTVL